MTPDGYLFLSLGDRWAGDLAQDLTQDEGTIIRIRTDGSIPADNPFRWLLGRGLRSGATGTAIRKASPSM